MNNIKIKNLSLTYGRKEVLKNINQEIEEKKITAIIGPSGCGKSSLLRCINRMNELIPESKVDGEILFHNKNRNYFSENMLTITHILETICFRNYLDETHL